MKLDLDYIKVLLNAINDCDDDRVELGYLIDTIKGENVPENEFNIKKLRLHLSILCSAAFLETSNYNLGFMEGAYGDITCNSNVKFWPTMAGYQLLESMNNDTLFNNITEGLKNIGVDTLKQIPALALNYIATKCLGL